MAECPAIEVDLFLPFDTFWFLSYGKKTKGDSISCVSIIICDVIRSLLCSSSDSFSRLQFADLLVLFFDRNDFAFLIIVISALDM